MLNYHSNFTLIAIEAYNLKMSFFAKQHQLKILLVGDPIKSKLLQNQNESRGGHEVKKVDGIEVYKFRISSANMFNVYDCEPNTSLKKIVGLKPAGVIVVYDSTKAGSEDESKSFIKSLEDLEIITVSLDAAEALKASHYRLDKPFGALEFILRYHGDDEEADENDFIRRENELMKEEIRRLKARNLL